MNARRAWQEEGDLSERSYSSPCCSYGLNRFWGGLLLLVGILLLFNNFDLLPILGQVFWPVLLIGIGVVNLVRIWRTSD